MIEYTRFSILYLFKLHRDSGCAPSKVTQRKLCMRAREKNQTEFMNKFLIFFPLYILYLRGPHTSSAYLLLPSVRMHEFFFQRSIEVLLENLLLAAESCNTGKLKNPRVQWSLSICRFIRVHCDEGLESLQAWFSFLHGETYQKRVTRGILHFSWPIAHRHWGSSETSISPGGDAQHWKFFCTIAFCCSQWLWESVSVQCLFQTYFAQKG